ncbi:hypothetical protein I550_1820 [Mycobacterium intracellulare 1956]|uniref:Uncharacterized protein n=1 Tax=Mycobacterium intracellulare 1956 TaxID=1299331 RepID=X8CQK2_MYCIT|nr:hypothetical protein I548_4780 [Mycobacterium intracellulare]EUA58677.1 hypothetical protein I550_1820 [Mycobacterium intracellulare 1956]
MWTTRWRPKPWSVITAASDQRNCDYRFDTLVGDPSDRAHV